MSTVKIQVISGKEYTDSNEVRVDNKLAYRFGHSVAVEWANLSMLIDLLQLNNVELSDKTRV